MIHIPVLFHVVRRNDGTGGATVTGLNQAVANLNVLFQPAGIAFYQCGTQPQYINSTRLFDYNIIDEDVLANPNDVPNAINIYITNTITYAGNPASGYAYYPSPVAQSNRIFVRASDVTGSSVPHEMGHYLNLYHTFQKNQSPVVADRELVIRPGDPQGTRPFPENCYTAGDLVGDTPADPYGLPGTATANCVYSGSAVDANGDLFAPMTSNIMSYHNCNPQFTPGQYARMIDGLSLRLSPVNAYSLNCPTNALPAPTNVTVRMQDTGALVQFSYPNAAAGFLIERGLTTPNSFTVVGSLPPDSFSFVDRTPLPNTTYSYRVKASNATTQYSTEQSVYTGLFYCKPTYTRPVQSFICIIGQFTMQGSLSTLRSASADTALNGYSNFTATPHAVVAGQGYPFMVSALPGSAGTYAQQHLTIWLDSNQDGLLSDSEILYKSSASQTLSPSISNTLVIPATAKAGLARLRLRTQYVSNGTVDSPCATYRYGEVEDYSLLVALPAPVNCFSLLASVTAVSCANGQDGGIQLATTGGNGPFSYSLATQTTTTGSFTGLSAGQYTVRASDATTGCNTSLSVTVTQPTPQSALLSGTTSVCGSRAVSLQVPVTGAGGPYQLLMSNGNSEWSVVGYVSNTPIQVEPTATTLYRLVSISDAAKCPVVVGPESATATVVVNQIAPVAIVPANATLCSGQSLTLTSSGEGTYLWNTGQTRQNLPVTQAGTYSVTVTDGAGCTSTAASIVEIATCPQSVLFSAKFLLEGFTDPTTGLMSTALTTGGWFPKKQPYSVAPWFYMGVELVGTLPPNVSDWVVVVARNALGEALEGKAAFVRNDGLLLSIDGTEGVLFSPLNGPVYVSIHHRSHLAVRTRNPVISGKLLDFTVDETLTAGTAQLKRVANRLALFVGDLNGDNVINNKDFNRWRVNSSAVGRYLPVDADGNGFVNNRDYNRWVSNRSKLGTLGL